MKHLLGALAALIVTLCALTACDDDTTTSLGSTLVTDAITVQVDSSFTLNGITVDNPTVQNRTTTLLLGMINAPHYGFLRSDAVTQFMPASVIDTAGITAANLDSIFLIMQFEAEAGWTGDSLAPMGLTAYPLVKQLPSPIYSDFNPETYYDATQPLGSLAYNASVMYENDTIQGLSYRQVKMGLPLALGKKLFNEYEKNPATFTSPTAFAEFFPGLYIKNSFGTGRITNMKASVIRLYYHQTYYDDDIEADTTIYKYGNYFAVTPEVINDNIIHLEVADDVKAMRNAGDVLLMAPAGYDAQIKFPAREVVKKFNDYKANRKVLNTLTMTIPVEAIDNKYDIAPPENVLLVLSSKKDEFFSKNQLPDEVYSFLSAYDSTNKCYNFTVLREYALKLIEKGLDNITDEDLTFTITPVTLNTETDSSSSYSSYYYYYYYGISTSTTEYIASVVPYVETPVMAKLDLSKVKIKLTFSTQSTL